jgi:lysylphosphatidylglycerol synthetase-like protein (DUF2156 family)
MENLWLKIKIWTKIILFTIVVIYLGIFIFQNNNQPLQIWWWFTKDRIQTSALEVIPITLLAGVVGTLIVRMAFRAVRQFRELRKRSAAAKLNRDVEDLKTKASTLQTKPTPSEEPKPSENP